MKKLYTLFLFLSVYLQPFAQNYPGYRSGNYTGVNGVFFNPASIADSRYQWDINLSGIHAGIGNNNTAIKLSDIGKTFRGGADSILFGKTNTSTNGTINVDYFGPSVLLNINSKTSFAFTTRIRAMANVENVDGNLIQSIKNDFNGAVPFSLNSNPNQKISVNGWTDFGASLGRVLFDNGTHFIKGGITLKYLAGTGNDYVNIRQLKATVDKDVLNNVYLANASGAVDIGYTGVDFDLAETKDAFKYNGNGVGGDIGFIYEYRPDGKNRNERDLNKYKLKIGLALLDIGSIKYKQKPNEAGSYMMDVSNAKQFYASTLDGRSFSEVKSYMDNSPFFTSLNSGAKSYTVTLPTNLQANVDYSINDKFYVEAAGQMNLVKKNNIYNSYYASAFSITPRFENSRYGVYLPLSYNELTHFNAGISFRAGPLFVGSGSIFTALFDKSKQADIHIGVNLGRLFKKQNKQMPVAVTQQAVAKRVADSNHDGISDDKDKCPFVAGTAKYNGCPVPDTDKDGINDDEDKCPAVAGIEKYSGCPIPDTDKDGVNDEEDKCPTIAGTAANKGCPAIKEEVQKKVTYAAKQIYFAAGKATLLSKSFPALNEVVKILKSNPGVRLQVEGYTDNSGKAAANLAMSQKRALAVKNYLVGKGIAANRITYKGYGHNNPIGNNKTAAGRAKNRRVELKLKN